VSSRKCARCGFVNWPDAESCKRCGEALTGDATTGEVTAAVAQPDEGRRKGSRGKRIVRSLLWAFVVHVGIGSVVLGLAAVYDWATDAPPTQTGAPHNFPKNPFVLLSILIISPIFAPFVYLLIAIALLVFFERRAARQTEG
jgi:hypothetical protein